MTRMKLIDQYNELLKEYNHHLLQIENQYRLENKVPKIIYMQEGKHLREFEVLGLNVFIKDLYIPSNLKKITRKELQVYKDTFNELKDNEPTIMYRLYHHAGANEISYQTIANVNSIKSKEEEQKKVDDYIYAHTLREGNEFCTYCGKQFPKDKMIEGKVVYRAYNEKSPSIHTHLYCSGQCNLYDQMAHEG